MKGHTKWGTHHPPGKDDPLFDSMPKMTRKIERYIIRNYGKKTRGQMADELGMRRFHLNMMTIRLKDQGKIRD